MNLISLKNNFNFIVNSLEEENVDSYLSEGFYNNLKSESVKRGRELLDLEEFLNPQDSPFLNPLNPVFLYSIYDLSAIRYVKYLMVRDGILGVVEFFERFPSPQSLKTIIILTEEFASLVPEEWYDNILFFNWHLKLKNDISQTSLLYLKGVLSANLFSKEYCKKVIEMINDHKFTEIFVYLPIRKEFFGKKGGSTSKTYDIFELLYRHTDAIIHHVDGEMLSNLKNPGRFIDLNFPNMIISDDYLTNCMLASGHFPLNIKQENLSIDKCFVQLSEYHGIVISPNAPSVNYNLVSEIRNMKKNLQISGKDLLKSDFVFYLKDLVHNVLPIRPMSYSLSD